jgi:diguanylate cyclase
LPEAPSEGSYKLCDRIRQNIEKTEFSTSKGKIRITVSIGICSKAPDHQMTNVDVVKCADEALYRAKHLGRNRVEVYHLEEKG